MSNKFGLIEMQAGKYFDRNIGKNLILALNYVDASGDEFYRQVTAMVMYRYEGGKNRTESTKVFLEYAEENLDLIEAYEQEEDDSTERLSE